MRAGLVLGERYRLEERLGRGGMGQVWRAVDLRRSQAVAVKLILSHVDGDEEMVRRFRREARISQELQHPGLTKVHEIGEHDGQPFIVMELLKGRDLAEVMADRPKGLPADEVCGIGAQIVEALRAAHRREVVHRDLKPANVFLLDGGTIKICDFGIARMAEATTQLTSSGAGPIGTPVYMAPEQWLGRRLDERTDLYSLGCVLFTLLVGRPPFTGTAPSLMRMHIDEDPPTVRRFRSEVPEELDRLIVRLLAKDPARRPGTDEILRTLRGLQRPALSPTLRVPLTEQPTEAVSSPTRRMETPAFPGPSPAPTFALPAAASPTHRGDRKDGRKDGRKSFGARLFRRGERKEEGQEQRREEREAAAREEALRRQRAAAELGDVKAMVALGHSLHLRQRTREAARWLRQAAEAGDAEGMAGLGLLLYRGREVEEAERWCRRAAEAGVPSAMFGAGFLALYRGKPNKARKRWMKAVALGDADAMFGVGEVLNRQEDEAAAELQWRAAADAGSVEAMTALGTLCEKKEAVDEAVEWWEKAVEAGDTRAMIELGDFHLSRYRPGPAMKLYQAAAVARSAVGATRMVAMYEKLDDSEQAARWHALSQAYLAMTFELNALEPAADIWYRKAGLAELLTRLEKDDNEVAVSGVAKMAGMREAVRALTGSDQDTSKAQDAPKQRSE